MFLFPVPHIKRFIYAPLFLTSTVGKNHHQLCPAYSLLPHWMVIFHSTAPDDPQALPSPLTAWPAAFKININEKWDFFPS